jgi:hypothetical protein
VSVDIPKATNIDNSALKDCEELVSVNMPEVIEIGNNAFSSCTFLTTITIPSSCNSIGDYAFWGCISLTTVTILSSSIAIGGNTFWGCTSSLTTITIPFNINYTGSNQFRDCSKLSILHLLWPSSIAENCPKSIPDILKNIPDPNQITYIDVKRLDGGKMIEMPSNFQYSLTIDNIKTFSKTNGWSWRKPTGS